MRSRSRPCSSIRCRRCSRPTAWDSPTSAPSARRGSRSRSTPAPSPASASSPTRLPTPRSRRSSAGRRTAAIKVHRRAHLRYAGSDTTIEVALRFAFRHAARLRARAQAALRLHRSRQGARHRGRVGRRRAGGAARFAERDAGRRCRARPSEAGARDAILLERRVARKRMSILREVAADRREPSTGRRSSSSRNQTIVVEQGWRAAITPKNHVVLTPRRGAAEARGDRLEGRSGDARNLQQPLHVDRRADGRDAAEHRLFGQHQGAARLLLRRVRRRGPPRRQRAAHAGASRLDGPFGRDDHPRQRGAHPARRRVRAQRALQRRHASARHHRLHAGLRRGRQRPFCSGRPRAAITPTSAASRPAR